MKSGHTGLSAHFAGCGHVFRGTFMKSLFSLVGLLLVLAIVAVLVKRQTASLAPGKPAVVQPGHASNPALPSLPTGTPQNQVDQVKKALDQAMQARPIPDSP